MVQFNQNAALPQQVSGAIAAESTTEAQRRKQELEEQRRQKLVENTQRAADEERNRRAAGEYSYNFNQVAEDIVGRKAATIVEGAQVGDVSLDPEVGESVDARVDQARGDQAALIAALQDRAAGGTPSAAELQLRRERDRNIATALALGKGQYGISAGQAARMSAEQMADLNQEAAGQAAVLRAGEQATAEQALIGALQGVRGQDITGAELEQARGLAEMDAGLQTALAQAGFDQATLQANLASEQGQRALNDQMVSYYTSLGYSLDEANRAARQEMQKLNVERERVEAEKAASKRQDKTQKQAGFLGLAGAALGAGGAWLASDKKGKTDITDGKNATDQLLDALKSYKFNYKDASKRDLPEGKRLGVMAQDVEKTAVGEEIVVEDKGGMKYLEGGENALGAILASLGRLQERADELEKKLGDK